MSYDHEEHRFIRVITISGIGDEIHRTILHTISISFGYNNLYCE